jgi:hypothetical protein
VLQHVDVAGCVAHPQARALERRTDGAYAAVTLKLDCTLSAEPQVRYSVLRDVDPTHRGLLRFQLGTHDPTLRVLDPLASPVARAAGGSASGALPAAGSEASKPGLFAEGVHHIVTGYDHVLFLMCLLLPSVMRRTPQGWKPVDRLGQAVLPVAGIVTAFTLAHSLTLGLAALKWVSLPPWFIEPAIAVTIVLAALDNLRPVFRGRRVLVTFGFGLIHGFGFAGVLGELNLPAARFAWALFQFNIGLEFGQLAIVLLATGALYWARRTRAYPLWAIRGGSCAAIVVGLLWFIERTADVSLLRWH